MPVSVYETRSLEGASFRYPYRRAIVDLDAGGVRRHGRGVSGWSREGVLSGGTTTWWVEGVLDGPLFIEVTGVTQDWYELCRVLDRLKGLGVVVQDDLYRGSSVEAMVGRVEDRVVGETLRLYAEGFSREVRLCLARAAR